MKEIQVMSRRKAIDFSYKIPNQEKKYAIISISEVSDTYPNFHYSQNLVDVLKLSFDDVDKNENGCYRMSFMDAMKIVDFLKKNEDKVDVLIVHCLAGRSRSTGVAAAIAKWKFHDDSVYFKEYTPNMHVYRTLLNALVESEQE